MFCHEGIVDKSLNEKSKCDDIEDKDVKDALSVVLKVGSEHVPLFEEPMTMSFCNSIYSKTLHSCNICVRVQIVLSGSFAVQANGKEVSLELLHHCFEVIIVETVLVTEPGRLEHAVYQLPNLLITQSPVIGQLINWKLFYW